MTKNSVGSNKEIGPGLYTLGDPRDVGFFSIEEIDKMSQGILSLKKMLLEISNSLSKKES